MVAYRRKPDIFVSEELAKIDINYIRKWLSVLWFLPRGKNYKNKTPGSFMNAYYISGQRIPIKVMIILNNYTMTEIFERLKNDRT